jgi:type I restriction enzyme, R subunit
VQPGTNYERFRAKARQFLLAHESHITIHKVRRNLPLTASDVCELERMLLEAGIGSADDLARAKAESHGLGLFIRSLVGLDREAAKEAFGTFLKGGTASANQIEFINLIVDYLTERGVMEASVLYESPFTDISPRGPEDVFSIGQVEQLVKTLTEIRERAAA